jgi:hypothetical protein
MHKSCRIPGMALAGVGLQLSILGAIGGHCPLSIDGAVGLVAKGWSVEGCARPAPQGTSDALLLSQPPARAAAAGSQ